MNAVFLKLLNMSAAGSVLILAVVLLRALLKKAPRWILCAMWALVAVRLVCPVSIASPVSVFRATPALVSESGEVELFRPTGGSEKPLLAVDTVQIERPSTNVETIQNIPGTSLAVTQRSRDAYLPPLELAYLLGLGAMLLYAAISTLLLRKKVAVSLRQRGNIRVCDEVASPFILGVLRPAIYLPSSLSVEEKRYVLAHERAHLSRLDHVWKPLGYLILSVHWFNPLCWLAYVLLGRDIERACDEKVIRELGRDERAAYSQTLLNCSAHRVLAACPVAFGETDVKARVKAVLNYKKPAFWIVLAAILACVVLTLCFAAKPVLEQERSFLNYKNAIPLIGQNGTAPTAELVTEGETTVTPGVADKQALTRFLETVRWSKCRAPSEEPGVHGYIEFEIEEDYRIIVYQYPRLAAVRFEGEIRYYRTGAGDYEAALAAFIPAPSAVPDRLPEPTPEEKEASLLITSDPAAFLRGFSDAKIVALIDNTDQSYEDTGKSFAEIISARSWAAYESSGFPASAPDRVIELVRDDFPQDVGWGLRFEESGGEMLCIASRLLSSSDTTWAFDCGENLMDELIAWALKNAGEPQVANAANFVPLILSFDCFELAPMREFQTVDPALIQSVWDRVNPAAAEAISEGSTWQISLNLEFRGDDAAIRLHVFPDDLMLAYYTGENYRLPEGTYQHLLELLQSQTGSQTGQQPGTTSRRMTLADVFTLVDKGMALTWADLLAFEGEEIGSGRLIWRFPINDSYCLEAYDGELDGPPERVLLLMADEQGAFRAGPGLYVDILNQDLHAFLSGAQTRSITLTSGGVSVEPALYLLNEKTWTEHGWLVADGEPLTVVLQDTEKIPTIPLAADFSVRFEGYTRKSGLQLYDEQFHPLRENWYGDTAVNWLAPGTYYGVIEVFGPQGRYIASEDASEESVYRAIFRLKVGTGGAEPYVPDKIAGLTEARLSISDGDYVLTDAESLAKLESWLKNAEPLPGGAGCPFGSVLTLECADGSKLSCCPAEDGCGIVFADGAYYRFAPDNEDFWALFGIQLRQG